MQFGVRPTWFSNLNVWIKGPDPRWRPQGSPLHPRALVPGGSVTGVGPMNQCSGSVLTGNGSKQSLVGQKSLCLIKSDLPRLFFFHGDSFLCSSKSSVRSWSYFLMSSPRSCDWVQVSDPPYIHCRACDELDIKSYFSVGLSCCPRTICLRVFPLLTLSKICLGNKGGCVSRLQSGPVSARALGLVIVASRRDFRSHVKNFWPFSSENQYWLLHVFCISIYLLSQLVRFCHQKVCWKFERCLWTQRYLTRIC